MEIKNIKKRFKFNKNDRGNQFKRREILNWRYEATVKICLVLCMSVILTVMSFTGCQSESGGDQSSDSDNSEKVLSDVSWEVQVYSDDYLSYEIPADWARSDEYSNSERKFEFFQHKDSPSEFSSNVNIQITKLNTGDQQNKIDYSSEEVQQDFHAFLLQEMGMPNEANDGEFKVIKSNEGKYIYSLSFERIASNNVLVRQTVFFPVNMEHSIVVWATDFADNVNPPADEVAQHICETLKVINK